MPNIIEQQDLLKGLPDARLVTLAQNPTGGIAPYLVYAEMLRRQQIRQQFASESPQESVADTLIKQIANVPQNVNAPTRTPPMVPPTPPMQGVMALQQQQAMADMAQQAQPQQMRGGGMVQRYQSRGLVEPTLESTVQDDSIFQDIVRGTKTFGGRAVDRLLDPLGIYDYTNYFFPDYISTPSEKIYETTGVALDPISIEKQRQAKVAEEIGGLYEMNRLDKEAGLRRLNAPPVISPEEAQRQREEQARLKKQYQEYAASQQKQPEETEDEYRARLEELLRAQEPSDWEKAQKWFAMSEQFLDPSKTTMQSIAGAGRAFSESAAEQARAQREAELNLKKGLLEYDMGLAAEKRAVEAERAKREYEIQQKILERRNPPAADVLKALDSMVDGIDARIKSLTDAAAETASAPDPKAIENLEAQKQAYLTQMSEILKAAGYGPSGGVVTEAQLRALAGGR